MSRSNIERQLSDRVTNYAFTCVDKIFEEMIEAEVKKFKLNPAIGDKVSELFPSKEGIDDTFIKSISIAYSAFKKKFPESKNPGSFEKFKQAAYYKACQRILEEKLQTIPADAPNRALLEKIVRSIRNNNTSEKAENNLLCLQEILKFKNNERSDDGHDFTIDEEISSKYPKLFLRFPELFRQQNLALANKHEVTAVKTRLYEALSEEDYTFYIERESSKNTLIFKKYPENKFSLVYVNSRGVETKINVSHDFICNTLGPHIVNQNVGELCKALGNLAPQELRLELAKSTYFDSSVLETDICVADNQDRFNNDSKDRGNRFIFREDNLENYPIVYVDFSGRHITLNVEAVAPDSPLHKIITSGNVPALRKVLGDLIPKDRPLELARRMYQKSQRGTTATSYASAKLGALTEIPERFLRNYLLDNMLIDWFTTPSDENSKAVKEVKAKVRERDRENQTPAPKNRTIKRLRARARQKQVSENFYAETFVDGVPDERVQNLEIASRMFNAQSVSAGLVSCKPCCMIIDHGEKTKSEAVTSDSHWLKLLNEKNYQGNAYIVKPGLEPPMVYYVDRSGVVPVITELPISGPSLNDLTYISGFSMSKEYTPREHVQRLKDYYSRESLSHGIAGREIQNMGHGLMSYMSISTGHIPTQQIASELEEKKEFNQDCDNLQRLLNESTKLHDDIIARLKKRPEYSGKELVLIDKHISPSASGSGNIYVHVNSGYPIKATVYSYSSDALTWVSSEISQEELIAEGLITDLDYKNAVLQQDDYDAILKWAIQGKVGACPVPLKGGVCYSVCDKQNSKVWVSRRDEIVVDVAPNGAGELGLNNWIKNHRADIAAQKKMFGIRYVDVDIPVVELTQQKYNEILIDRINGKKNSGKTLLEVGVRYHLQGKPNAQVWLSSSGQVIVDCTGDKTGHPGLDNWISVNMSKIKRGEKDGLRFIDDSISIDINNSYLNSALDKQVITEPVISAGEAKPLTARRTSLNYALAKRVQKVLDRLQQIEDLPSSYLTTSDSIVPYDTRQELIAKLTEYVRNPQSDDVQNYFRDRYTIQSYDKVFDEGDVEGFKLKPFSFHYSSKTQDIYYVDANSYVHVGKLPSIPKQYRTAHPTILDSKDVFEHITSKMPSDCQIKVHTANEALEEIFAEEVVSLKTIASKVLQIALSVLFVLLVCCIPFVGQVFAGLGVSMAFMWIGAVVANSVLTLFLAKDISKTTLISSARSELKSLKEELMDFTDANNSEEFSSMRGMGPPN